MALASQWLAVLRVYTIHTALYHHIPVRPAGFLARLVTSNAHSPGVKEVVCCGFSARLMTSNTYRTTYLPPYPRSHLRFPRLGWCPLMHTTPHHTSHTTHHTPHHTTTHHTTHHTTHRITPPHTTHRTGRHVYHHTPVSSAVSSAVFLYPIVSDTPPWYD